MPLNDAGKNDSLKSGTGGGVAGIVTHIGVHTIGADGSTDSSPGTGTNAAATEASGGSPAYARQAVTWGTPSAGQVSNTGALTFDVPAGTYGFFALYNAVTGNTGNFRGHLPFGGASPLKGFFSTDTNLANDTLFSIAHGLANGDRVILFNVFAETLPTGLSEGNAYFVVSSATNSFKVSTTSGGAAVDITALGGGEGYFQKVVPEVFGSQGQITVAAGQLILDATGV